MTCTCVNCLANAMSNLGLPCLSPLAKLIKLDGNQALTKEAIEKVTGTPCGDPSLFQGLRQKHRDIRRIRDMDTREEEEEELESRLSPNPAVWKRYNR